MFRGIIIGCLLAYLASCYGQNDSYELPIYFGQYFNDPHFNPAKNGTQHSIDAQLGHRRNSNNFGNIHSSFFAIQKKFAAQKNGFHVGGLEFNNDKEGFVIKRNRFYGSYARHIALNEVYFLGVGVSLGWYNFGIDQNYAFEGASSYAFDANAGILFHSKRTEVGLSINQLNNARLQPVEQVINLSRHYTLNVSRAFDISENLSLRPSLYARYIGSNPIVGRKPWNHTEVITFGIKELIYTGMSIELNQGNNFFLGVHNIRIFSGKDRVSKLNVDFSYFIPNSDNIANINTYEFVLRYFIDKP